MKHIGQGNNCLFLIGQEGEQISKTICEIIKSLYLLLFYVDYFTIIK